MTKTMNHSNCHHPATKAARAACRKAKAQEATAYDDCAATIRYAYFNGDADAEEILGMIAQLGIEVDTDADIETIIASL